MKNNISNRQAICETLMELACNDADIVVLTSDSRGSAGLAPFAEAFPQQFIEAGIAEQNIVGMAAGLAVSGKKPICASPASFLSMRSAEQVKVDVAYSQTAVVLLGISGGISYGALGMTHHSVQDIALMRTIPGLEVILPADRFESASVIRDLMRRPRAAYVRIGRNPVEDVFEEGSVAYTSGKAVVLHQGNDAAIIASGETVRFALDAAIMLEDEGIGVRVYDMHTIKPLDVAAIREAVQTRYVLTMEEASIFGGLGGAVCEVAAQTLGSCPVKIFGLPDEPVVTGKSAEVFRHYGITAENAANEVRRFLNS